METIRRRAHANPPAKEEPEELYEDGDDYADQPWPPRMPRSALHYQRRSGQLDTAGDEALLLPATPVRRRVVIHHGLPPAPATARHRSADTPPSAPSPQAGASSAQPASRWHWLIFIGYGMAAMLLLFFILTEGLAWWQGMQTQWQYGSPRTFQVDMQVGHGTGNLPSHFIALNLNGHINVIECPQEDCTHAVIFSGPQLYSNDAASVPASLSFSDVNGDGKLDMLVHVSGQLFVLVNTGSTFRQATPNDHVTLPSGG